MRQVKEISPEVHCPKLLFPSPIIAEEHSPRSLEEMPNCQTTIHCHFVPFKGMFFHFLSSPVKAFLKI